MEGRIDKIWENETKDKKKYHVLEIGEDRYSVWHTKLLNGIQEGDSINYEWKNSGNFKKITDLRKIDLEPVTEPYVRDRKSIDIIRMSCLRSASEILNGLPMDLDSKTGLALDIAKEFEKYVIGSEEGESV